MKNAFRVYKRDIKSMFTNPVALVIIIGICIIPSLYAWVNIKASWDPYENTSTIPVAVVNEDAGTTFDGKSMNIGDDVVNQLKQNNKIGWKFVTAEQANAGIADGTYYAIIEIPSNFSKNLTSLTTNNPVKADIIYKVNTKVNPVANKITDAAESTLVTQIKTSFLDTVNKEVFSKLNVAGGKIKENEQNILKLKDSVINVNNNMDLITNVLNSVSTGATNLDNYLNTVKMSLPQITASLNNVKTITVNTGQIIDNTNSTLSTAFNNIGLNLQGAQSEIAGVQGKLSSLNSGSNTAAQAQNTITNIKGSLTKSSEMLGRVKTFLESMQKSDPKQSIANLINTISNVQSTISDEQGKLDLASNAIDQTGQVKESALNAAINGLGNVSSGIGNVISTYNNSTKGDLQTIGSGLSSSTKTAAELINKANGLVEKMNDVLSSASSSSQLASSTATSINSTLNQFRGVISELSKQLGNISTADLNNIITLLQGNPEVMGNFMSEPFNVEEESVFPIHNYGSGMAPIYTVLCLWVGALLLSSLLKVRPPEFEGSENISIREKHFGKMFTFVTLGIVQSIVVTVGDKYILGVQTASFPLLLAFGIATGITFGIIVFTLVSLLGNMGKATAIVLMVVQLAGTGGTYPVQVLPLFFRIIQPIAPFTYAVEGFREAVAGVVVKHVVTDFVVLFAFSLGFVLLGYFLKPLLDKPMAKFEEKFEESGIGE